MLRYLILGVLRDGAARHGYGIMKEYRESAGADVSVGNFYRELQRLVGDGHVRAVANPSGADPRRIPYEITSGGSTEFDRWLPSTLQQPVTEYQDEVVMRAFLASRARDTVCAEVVARWRDELRVRCEMARLAHQAARRVTLGDATSFDFREVLLARRLQQAVSDLAFADEFERTFRRWVERRPERDEDRKPLRRGKAAGPVLRTPRETLRRARTS